jgi:hypothetical protein
MGFIIGNGRSKIIEKASNAEFREAINSRAELIEVPFIKPIRQGHGGVSSVDKHLAKKAYGDVVRNAPLFNDPRYSASTLAIPTDNRTLYGLYRFFAETDPIVGAALRMHSDLPLADLQLGQCGDSGIQSHYEEMWERINGHKTLNDTVSEYYEIGSCTLFGAFNTTDYMWDQFAILNPDYVSIESTWVNQKPLIKLVPDESLKKIVQTQSPRFLYEQLPPEIIRYVLFNQEIPLDPNNVFQIDHAKRPYENRGKSLIKRILKVLMLEDRFNQANFALATRHAVPLTIVKVGDQRSGWIPNDEELDEVRELMSSYELDPNFCYDEETECLTSEGWKDYTKLSYKDKVACFNENTNGIEYYNPEAINIQDYDGNMYHFKSRTMDKKVTPNHRMWAKRNGKWQIILAENIKAGDKFRTIIDSCESTSPLNSTISVAGKEVNTEAFFKFVGWYLAEGSISLNKKFNQYYQVMVTQATERYCPDIEAILNKLPWTWAKYGSNYSICNKVLGRFVADNFGLTSDTKKIPRWIVSAQAEYLQGLIEGWLHGDGTYKTQKNGDIFSIGSSASKELVDAMQEIAFKCGYASRSYSYKTPYTILPGEHERRIVRKTDGTPFFDIHKLTVTKGKLMSYPGISRREVIRSIPNLQIDIDNIPKRGKQINWGHIDLQNHVNTAGGIYSKVAKAFNVSTGTIIEQAKRQGVEVAKRFIEGKEVRSRHIKIEKYTGKIWCVTTPTGIIVTRRKGHIAIEGQSVIWHWGIDVQYYGSNGKMLPVGPELDRLYRLKFIGMGIHEQIITGSGGTYSVPGDHLVVYRDGVGNIIESFLELWNKTPNCPVTDDGIYEIKDISKLGYSTLSLDGEGNQNWTSIKSIIRHKLTDKDKLLQISTSTSRVISTAGHGFMWLNPKTWAYEEVAADKLTKNNALVDIFNLKKFGKDYNTIWNHPLTSDMAYFLGVWNADGCLGVRNGYDLAFNSNNMELIEKVKEVAERLSFDRVLYRPRLIAGEHSLYMYWRNLKLDLCEFYKIPMQSASMAKTGREHIAEEILFNTDKNIVGAYIAGELDGDGSVTENQVWFVSASKRFLLEMSFLFRRFGIAPNAVEECTNSEGTTQFNINIKMYHMSISDRSSFSYLYDLVSPFLGLTYKKERLLNLFKDKIVRELNRNMYPNKVSNDSVLCNRQRILSSKKTSTFEKLQASRFDTTRITEEVKEVDKVDDYVYDLELAKKPHTYMVCGDGWILNHNSQAYINLEIQRQRYLNLQLKLQQLVHTGWFRPIADMCGFYKINNATSHGSTVKSYRYGSVKDKREEILQQFSSLRDDQDNIEFQNFVQKRAEEEVKNQSIQVRDYIYPELDFGGMSASSDENLKNYVKWLAKERPHLVDDATLARLGKLDRDKMETAYIKDAERTRDRWKTLSEKGLLPFIPNAKGAKPTGGGMDLGGGGISSIPGGAGGIDLGSPAEGGAPNEPIGAGGPPESAEGEAPAGTSSSLYDREEQVLASDVSRDDVSLIGENNTLAAAKSEEKRAILRLVKL